jgi:glycosyltransferase involved in cell wall biosynthesis
VTTLSVVVPMLDAADHLPRVLPPLVAALRERRVAEVIAVDDGCSDDSVKQCEAAGLRVVKSGGRLGPAGARNAGARAASGDALLFVDADVVVHDDVAARVAAHFDARADVVALFGAYDDRPAAPGVVSRYRNLLHHHVHNVNGGEASTFWAGCGAVRRAAFLAVGGFDEKRYRAPSIEDIELGQRLRATGGKILLDPKIEGTHLKRWTFASMVRTDVMRRALPWGRLLQATPGAGKVLNVTLGERLRALLALALLAAAAGGLLHRPLFGVAAALLFVAALANAPFYALVARRAGLLTALAALFLHQLYYVYGTATFAWCVVERWFGGGPR